MGALGEQFRSDEGSRHSDWLRQQRWFIKARQDHQRREEGADKIENEVTALAAEVVMATQTQIKSFEVKLDSYDEATVVALMENQDLIDAVQDRLASILARAYVMQDGRRVFKTEDGTQVFDEFGVEVDPRIRRRRRMLKVLLYRLHSDGPRERDGAFLSCFCAP